MKTFKWTFPEFPMTQREKNPPKGTTNGRPGLWKVIGGVLFSLMSLLYFSTSSGFIKGIRTYFWDSTDGQILSSDLRSHTTSGGGEVTYSVEVGGVSLERTEAVFEKWSGDNAAKYSEWESGYAVGNHVTVFFNQSGETSLGHWPTAYSYQFGAQGIGTLALGLTLFLSGIKQMKKANKSEQATPRRPSDQI